MYFIESFWISTVKLYLYINADIDEKDIEDDYFNIFSDDKNTLMRSERKDILIFVTRFCEQQSHNKTSLWKRFQSIFEFMNSIDNFETKYIVKNYSIPWKINLSFLWFCFGTFHLFLISQIESTIKRKRIKGSLKVKKHESNVETPNSRRRRPLLICYFLYLHILVSFL